METSLKSVSYASKRLGVSPFTIRRLIDTGALKAVHVGARVLIPTAEIERVVERGAGTPRPPRGRSVRRRSRAAEKAKRLA